MQCPRCRRVGKRVLKTGWVDTWKVAKEGTKEPKSRLALRFDQKEQRLIREKIAPTTTKSACKFMLAISMSMYWEPITIDIQKAF